MVKKFWLGAVVWVVSLMPVCRAEDWTMNRRYADNGSGFEISGKMTIVIQDDLLPDPESDSTVLLLAERLAFLSGFQPVILSTEGATRRKIVVRRCWVPLDETGTVKARMQVGADRILIEGESEQSVRELVRSLAESLSYEDPLLERSEIHNWSEVQKPERVCRWIYRVPPMTADLCRKTWNHKRVAGEAVGSERGHSKKL